MCRDLLERTGRVGRVVAQATQQRRGRLGHLERGRVLGELLQHRSQLQQRVVAGLRQRRVSGSAGRRQLEAKDALLRAADAVAAPAVVFEHLAAALVEQHVAADLVRVGPGQPVRAEIASGLLVGHEHELQRAARRTPALARQRGPGDRLGRDLRLHVDRASAPQVAVDHVARPRVVLPLGWVGQDRVDVARGTEASDRRRRGRRRASRPGSGDPRPPPAAPSRKPACSQVGREVLDRRALVARRVDGVEADEALKDFGGLALQVSGRHPDVSLVHRTDRRSGGHYHHAPCPRISQLALALADVADAITLERYLAEDLAVETKPDLTPVTEADHAVERALRERLAARCARRLGTRRGVRRSRPLAGGRAAGSSIRSTGPRITCAGSRCGRRCWRSQDGDEITRGRRLGARPGASLVGRSRPWSVRRRRPLGRPSTDARLGSARARRRAAVLPRPRRLG